MTPILTLDSLRPCLEGVIPSVISTCAPDGTPNVTYVSQVHYVDQRHVALTFQFFNKTRENILANPHAVVQLVDPNTAAQFRLGLRYLRTETDGPLFECMKARLAGIASHTGMAKVFRLLGADIYHVTSIEGLPRPILPCAQPARNRLTALRNTLHRMSHCGDLNSLFNNILAGLQQEFEIHHAMLLMYDEPGGRLYTVASCGYETSGIGAEIPLGAGVIGTAAKECMAIRIMYMTGETAYSRAVRDNLRQNEPGGEFETEIPFPGLTAPHSQLAVPIVRGDRLLGVLYVESVEDLRFTYEDEDAMTIVAGQLALQFESLQTCEEHAPDASPSLSTIPARQGATVTIRHYTTNDSIFIDDDYLIKGVAGAIIWKLLRCHTEMQRCEFSNRELRLDPSLGLPDIGDNLEARLILLQKRLIERCDFMRIEKTGRGRFRLRVDRPLTLEAIN